MAISVAQVTVPTGTIATLMVVPPSLCNVTFWNSATSGTLYVGTSTAVTSVNGLTCHSIPTSFTTYVGSKGATLYGTAATATAVFNYITSTDF